MKMVARARWRWRGTVIDTHGVTMRVGIERPTHMISDVRVRWDAEDVEAMGCDESGWIGDWQFQREGEEEAP